MVLLTRIEKYGIIYIDYRFFRGCAMESLLEAFEFNSVEGAIAQIIGFIALVFAMVSYQMKTQKKIVLIQIVSCSFFALHFLMLGAYTGALMNLIAAIRSVVFANKDKKWGRSNWWIVFFSLVCVVAVGFTWEGTLSLMPMAGMVLTSVAWGIEKASLVRLISLPSSPLWIVYNFICGSTAGVLTEVFVMISIITAMIRLDLPKKKAGK